MAEIYPDLKLSNLEIVGKLYVNGSDIVEDLSGRIEDLSGRIDGLDLSGSGGGVSQDIFDDLSGTYYGNQQNNNSAIYGSNAGSNGGFNTYIGVNSGGNASGSSNIGLGYSAGFNISGDNNVAIGFESLISGSAIDVSNSVFIGKESGANGSILRTNDVFQLQNSSTNYLMTGDFNNSNIAIGLNRLPNPSYSLETAGDISASNIFLGQNVSASNLFLLNNASISGIVTANEFLSESDLTLKKNIRSIHNGLEILQKLSPVYYQWKDENKGTQEESGFIAQDVEKIMPSLVQEVNSIKHVAYSKFTAILTSSIQQQQVMIQNQNEMIQKQQQIILSLENRIRNIELQNKNKFSLLSSILKSPAECQ